MANGSDVLAMLIPTGGWVIYGDDFDSIVYDEGVKPISKKEYTDGFTKVDAFKGEQDKAKAQAKAVAESKLAALGLTTDDLRALGL